MVKIRAFLGKVPNLFKNKIVQRGLAVALTTASYGELWPAMARYEKAFL